MKRITTILLIVAFSMSPFTASAITVPPPPPGSSSIHTGTAWWIMVCPGGVVTAAMAKNWRRHKELTRQEAWTCGLLYWWNEATGQYGR
ncbi:MAG TPA: hypothetical protein VNR41_14865 [Xanthobacteraceae bacterium]|nr:hypothetical protein [Xanthobacteraceae bacterium]